MNARHCSPRAALGGRAKPINGITPGSTDHMMLLALRGCGGMNSEQIYARFNNASPSLHRLKSAGLIDMPRPGTKAQPIHLTEAGRALTDASGPLARSKTLFTYCQL